MGGRGAPRNSWDRLPGRGRSTQLAVAPLDSGSCCAVKVWRAPTTCARRSTVRLAPMQATAQAQHAAHPLVHSRALDAIRGPLYVLLLHGQAFLLVLLLWRHGETTAGTPGMRSVCAAGCRFAPRAGVDSYPSSFQRPGTPVAWLACQSRYTGLAVTPWHQLYRANLRRLFSCSRRVFPSQHPGRRVCSCAHRR